MDKKGPKIDHWVILVTTVSIVTEKKMSHDFHSYKKKMIYFIYFLLFKFYFL